MTCTASAPLIATFMAAASFRSASAISHPKALRSSAFEILRTTALTGAPSERSCLIVVRPTLPVAPSITKHVRALSQSVTMANYTIVVYCTSAVAAYHGEHAPRHSLRRSHCSKSMPLARLSISNRVVATQSRAASGQQIVRDSDLAGFFARPAAQSRFDRGRSLSRDAKCPTHQAKK